MMTSLGTEYYQIFLAQGLCVGLGTGCLFLPSVAIVATYFSTKRALATGITAAGGSIGSVIYPIVFRQLQPRIGFPWATRVLGFIALGTLTISVFLMKPRMPPPSKTRSLFDRGAFRSLPYVVFSLGMFLAFIGLYIPFFYIVLAAERKFGLADDLSNYMLSLLNAASVFGRIIPGLLADKFGSLEILTYCTISAAILSFAFPAVHNLGGLVVYCLFYGFLSGAVVSLPTTVVAGLVPELRLMGTWMGMSFSFAGLGLLIGNPIAGTIINVAEKKFTGGFIFSASTVIAAGIVFVGVGAYRPASFKWWKKVTGTQREVPQ
jgi:MFS family permease